MRDNFINNFQYSWVSVGVAGGSALLSGYKFLKSKSQDKSAAAEGAALRRPSYQIQPEYYENRNIAAQQATGGLSSAEKTYAGEQRERGLSSSLEALKQTGGGPNDFSQLSHVFDDSLKSQSALDAQLHLKNINFFTQTNKDLAGQKTTQRAVNELQPYETKLKEIQDRRIAAQTNENNAINEEIGSLSAGATGFNSFMKTNPAGATSPPGPAASPYNRTFGLADTGGGVAGSPASQFPTIDSNSYSTGTLAQLPDASDNY
jgi:hypothetical protein